MSYIDDFTCLYNLYKNELMQDNSKNRGKLIQLNDIDNILRSSQLTEEQKSDELNKFPALVREIETWPVRKLHACDRYRKYIEKAGNTKNIDKAIKILSNKEISIQQKYQEYNNAQCASVVYAASEWFEREISRRLVLCYEYRAILGKDDQRLLNLIKALKDEKDYGQPLQATDNELWAEIERFEKQKTELISQQQAINLQISTTRSISAPKKRAKKGKDDEFDDCVGVNEIEQNKKLQKTQLVQSVYELKIQLLQYKLAVDKQKPLFVVSIRKIVGKWTDVAKGSFSEFVGSILGEFRAELPIDDQGGVFEAMISACPTMADTLKDTFTTQPKVGVDFYLLHLAYKYKQFSESNVTDAATKAVTLHGALSDIITQIKNKTITETDAGERWSNAITAAASLREFRGCLAILERLLALFSFGYYQSESGKLLTQLNKTSIAQFFEPAKTTPQTPDEEGDPKTFHK